MSVGWQEQAFAPFGLEALFMQFGKPVRFDLSGSKGSAGNAYRIVVGILCVGIGVSVGVVGAAKMQTLFFGLDLESLYIANGKTNLYGGLP